MFCQFSGIAQKMGMQRDERFSLSTLKFFLYVWTLSKAMIGTKSLRMLEIGAFCVSQQFGMNLIMRIQSFERNVEEILIEFQSFLKQNRGL